MQVLKLDGEFMMRRVGDSEWVPARVPGSVYADLLRAGKLDDPFYRENESAATAVTENDYEYRRAFSVPGELLAHQSVLLRCEGLDTLCELFINGQPVLQTQNMHRTYEIEAKPYLKEGENELRVLLRSPNRYVAQKHAQTPLDKSTDALHGFSYLRKAQCMFGWDWGPKLPDMGIWRSVSLVGWGEARLSEVYITQTHATGRVTLHVSTSVQRLAQTPLTVTVTITAPGGEQWEQCVFLASGQNKKTLEFIIETPQLWWPSGMGAQPLYTLRAALSSDAGELSVWERRIGLRTLTVQQNEDEWGRSFAFAVNGVPFFAKGGDYIPQDSILSRVTLEKTQKLIKSCVQAHFNMLRVWGGGYYPDDFFYDLCDENGLVVWQDLAFACALYPADPGFLEECVREAQDNVRRIRHHACLGLWCGNNEMESAWNDWGWDEAFGPEKRADYKKLFETVLPETVRACDPNTCYWPSSPSSGGGFDDPNGESRGDMHYWGVWHALEPFTAYRQHFPRFMSEFGIQSFPCLKTVESFTEPGDRNIFSPVLEAHQKNSTANGKILHYISETYRYPKNFDSLLYASQLLQAEGIRYGVEHWRRNRGRCMGALYWQVNDCWPVASWAGLDYYGRWKALHYEAKRFFAPVLLSACEEGERVELHVTNDGMEGFTGTVTWRLLDAHSRTVQSGEVEAALPALSTAKAAELDFSKVLLTREQKRSHILAFSLESDGRTVSHSCLLFVKPKHFTFFDPRLSLAVKEADDRFVITVRAREYARYVELSLTQADGVFSDNYFDLPGGQSAVVTLQKENLSQALTLAELSSQLRVRSVYDMAES